MDNSELERLLKSAEPPERPPEYWEQFPERVAARLHQAPSFTRQAPASWLSFCSSRLWRPAWGVCAALLCLVIGFSVGHWRRGDDAASAASISVLQNEQLIHEVMAMFPNRLRAIVQDERGLTLVLSENADVPISQPLFVEILYRETGASAVTFSGQELNLAGRKIAVLSDSQGSVLLVGENFAWSSAEPDDSVEDLRIRALPLPLLARN
jgi:hypothetical protein